MVTTPLDAQKIVHLTYDEKLCQGRVSLNVVYHKVKQSFFDVSYVSSKIRSH